MDEQKWRKMQVLIVVLTGALVCVSLWSMWNTNFGARLFGGSERVSKLVDEPLTQQVYEAFADEATRAPHASSRETIKPTPAAVEIHIITDTTISEVIRRTRELPAAEQWSELPSCSSVVAWCASRTTDDGVTLLATWTEAEEQPNSADRRFVWTVSEN